jgi:hypothetical protein
MANKLFIYNGSIMYQAPDVYNCTFADWGTFTALTGLSSTDGLPVLSALPLGSIHNGACQMLNKFFKVGGTIFYQANDGHYCHFTLWDSFFRSSGLPNADDLPQLTAPPPGAIDNGTCP